MALIRYPGSKEKLADPIMRLMPEEVSFELCSQSSNWEYREPFFGAGAIGFRVMRTLGQGSRVVVNDIDRGMVCLWRAVHKTPQKLIDMIERFKPSADYFYEFKQSDGDETIEELRAGFRKLALHQMSVSGFGAMSGGPLGGREQNNPKYPVDCRWNASRLKRHVAACHKVFRRFEHITISHGDFESVIDGAGERCCIYLDPPYVEKGSQLYKYNMSEADHRRLAARLHETTTPWVLSYDDHPLIRSLYDDCNIHELSVTYSNAVCKTVERPKNGEIVIVPR